MRIGYYWPTLDNELIDCNSCAAREFFIYLIKNDHIVFNTKKVKPYNYFDLNDLNILKRDADILNLDIIEFALTIFKKPETLQQVDIFYTGKEKNTRSYEAAAFIQKYFNRLGYCKNLESPLILCDKWNQKISIKSLKELMSVDFSNYELETSRNISISDYVSYRLANDSGSISWLENYLTEDTKIKGFTLTQQPYEAKHQNLFHQNSKLDNFIFENSFLIKRTNNKSDILYLCSKRTFNPSKVRLVLKSHPGNQVRGIIMINGLSSINLKAHDLVYVEQDDFKISYISQIHLENKSLFYIDDNDLDYGNIPKDLYHIKDQIIELYKKSNDNHIPVEFHNFMREEFRSSLRKYNEQNFDVNGELRWRGIPSIIGNRVADFNYIDNYGNPIKTYFSELFDYSIEVDFKNNHNCSNYYVGTYFSKSKNVYMLIQSPNIGNWLNYSTVVQWDYYDSGEGQIFDCTHRFIFSAEQGKTPSEIEKLKANDKVLHNESASDDNDWGINWDLYNDELDMDQQDPDFW